MTKKSLVLIHLVLVFAFLLPQQAQAYPICESYCTDLSRCPDECVDTSLEIPSWRLCHDTQYLNCPDPDWIFAAAPTQKSCETAPVAR